tara:strand:- start:111 stop:722 length:612 start_codon:yes stop_codon:yes gene_type:complete
MNNLNKAYEEVSNVGDYSIKYFRYLYEVLESINVEEINKLADLFERSQKNGNTIFVAGNGGSSTTATTMANDIGFDILKKTGIEKPFKVLSLCDNQAVTTAIANDVGYENIFINQLKIHFRSGDNIILISASGNSSNIIKAANWVKKRKGTIVGFLGFSGGRLIDLCDIKIHVKSEKGEYGPVEDAHLIVNHILAHWFQNKLN